MKMTSLILIIIISFTTISLLYLTIYTIFYIILYNNIFLLSNIHPMEDVSYSAMAFFITLYISKNQIFDLVKEHRLNDVELHNSLKHIDKRLGYGVESSIISKGELVYDKDKERIKRLVYLGYINPSNSDIILSNKNKYFVEDCTCELSKNKKLYRIKISNYFNA